MKITVNKNIREIKNGSSLIELLKEIKMPHEKTLVSINNEIIPQDEFAKTYLKENDELDLFSFVGGG